MMKELYLKIKISSTSAVSFQLHCMHRIFKLGEEFQLRWPSMRSNFSGNRLVSPEVICTLPDH